MLALIEDAKLARAREPELRPADPSWLMLRAMPPDSDVRL